MRSQLGEKPAEASRLRDRVRQERHRRERRQDLHGNRFRQRRPGEPKAGDSPVRRDSDGAAVDHLREGHGDPAEGGADHELVQDHRREGRERAHRRRPLHHRTVREQHHHPRNPHTRLQAGRERECSVIADALRVEDAVGRRRSVDLRVEPRLGGPLLAVELP